MGRRSTHTPDELREMILGSARAIIESQGLAGLSARTIARRIGYSPGTIYNMFRNLDDVVLRIETRLLEDLDQYLAAALREASTIADGRSELIAFGRAYVAYTRDNRRLWNLLSGHHLTPGAEVPDWYRSKLEGLPRHLEPGLAKLMPDAEPDRVRRSAKALWASVHGIASLASADKLRSISTDVASHLVQEMVTTYAAGLGSPSAGRA